MTSEPTSDGGSALDWAWQRSPQPVWLTSPFGPLFAWYHPPRDGVRNCAVLLCDTFGSDRMNMHLTYRHMALQLSHAGFPCLRVDYPGTGDSAGMPRDAVRMGSWMESLGIAADFLRQSSGADRLAVFGARLGGTLGARFAAERADVTDVALWGPYLEGRQFLRQCRALQRMMASNPNGRRPSDWQPGDMESIGFLLTAEMVQDLERTSLTRFVAEPFERACVLAWDETTGEIKLADDLRQLGVAVDHVQRPLAVAQQTLERQTVAQPVIEHIVDWLAAAHPFESPHSTVKYGPAIKRTPATICHQDSTVTEEAVYLDPDRGLFGILTTPTDSAQSNPAWGVILVNGGNNHRPGINRNSTEWARRWAARGWTVLRFDICGLGDSPPQRQADLNVLYRTETAEDVVAAMDWLAARRGLDEFIIGGICAGAYQALCASVVDVRVRGTFLLELLRYYPDRAPVRTRLGRLWARGWALQKRYLLQRQAHSTRLSDCMAALCERGTEVLAVFNEDGGAHQDFMQELAPAMPRMKASGRLGVHLIPDGDHIFSPLWCQERLTETVEDFLDRIAGFDVNRARGPDELP